MSIVNISATLCSPFVPNLKAKFPSEEHGATVIVVPDIASPHEAHSWSDGSTCWLSSILPVCLANQCVLEFGYGLNSGSDFSWEQLLHCGDTLLQHLCDLARDTDLLARPLIFISHGFGGVIVKRAVGMLYKQFYDPIFEKIIKILCGINFLGVPHPVPDRPEQWSKLGLLLRASSGLSKKAVDKTGAQLTTIARTSLMFDESGTDAPILTVYEGKPTKIGTGFLSPKREILVDESFAKTSARREQLIKADAHHLEICNIDLAVAPHLKAFLQRAIAFMPSMDDQSTQGPESIGRWTYDAMEELDADLLPSKYGTNMATANSSEPPDLGMGSLGDALASSTRTLNLPFQYFGSHVRNPEFVGREDVLSRVKEALVPDLSSQSPGLKTFAMCGVGGLGKTQIAVEFAYSMHDDFDAIFILQADDPGKLAQAFTEISVQLGLETESAATDQIVSKNVVLGWLSQPVREVTETVATCDENDNPVPTWLLIFDNADDLSVLRDFWPVSDNGAVLVTSRDPLAKTKTHISVAKGLELDPLPMVEGGKLLRELTGINSSEDIEYSEAISEKLSGLPLALKQIAGTITRRDLLLDEFLELYDKESLRLDFHQSDVSNSSKTLYTVWAFEDLSQKALALLNVISFLDPDQISEQILTNMSKLEQGERLSGYPLDTRSFIDTRVELAKSSLVKRYRDRRELVIHRIIQDVTRSRMDPIALEKPFIAVVNLLYFSWPFSRFDFSTARWKLCEPVLAHVAYFHRLYESNDALKSIQAPRAKIARLFMDFGWYYLERGNIPGSLPYFAACESVCKLAPDETQITLGDNEGCLAEVASTTNNPRAAIPHALKSVKIFEVHAPEGDFRLPQAHNALAEAYIAAGRWEEAIEQTDLAIAGYNALPWENYPDWPMMNKGLSLCNLERLDEASDTLESYLEHRERCFGPMDTRNFKTGQGLLFLGKVRESQGLVSESLDLYLKALAQYHSTIGPKHFRVAALYYKLGMTYESLNEPDEAIIMFKKALDIYDDSEDYVAQIAQTCISLSQAYIAQGLVDEASESIRKGNDFMKKLGMKQNRKIREADLAEFIPNWSK